MAQVLVRNVSADVVEKLKSRDKRNHRSLEAEMRAIFARAANEPYDDVLTQVERVRQLFAGRTFDDSAVLGFG